MKQIKEMLARYEGAHDLTKPTTMARVEQFEAQLHLALPKDVKTFLTTIGNGGEIFVPGTVLYGIYDRDCGHVQEMSELMPYWNRAEIRMEYQLPRGFYVIGMTNYGNVIGIDEKTGKIVEWDHEVGKPFITWDTFREYLAQEIAEYERYLREEGE